MTEIWKDSFIDGVQVSNLGRVKNKSKGTIYKGQINKSNGYRYVDFRTFPIGRYIKVSRLVATAFIPNPENKPCVDHINTIRSDDRAENLRWVTWRENMNNPITKKNLIKSQPKECLKRRVPVLQLDLNGNLIKEWDGTTSFGKKIGKDVCGNIIACIKGKQATAYGYKWKYKNDKN